MNSRAYLMMRMKLDGDNEPKIKYVGIYSEPPSNSVHDTDCDIYACLLISSGYSYDDAWQKIINIVFSFPTLAWTRKYFKGCDTFRQYRANLIKFNDGEDEMVRIRKMLKEGITEERIMNDAKKYISPGITVKDYVDMLKMSGEIIEEFGKLKLVEI